MSAPALRVDPLVWGHGPKELEIFLEPTCPYSVRTFDKLDELLPFAYELHPERSIGQYEYPLFYGWIAKGGNVTAVEQYLSVVPKRMPSNFSEFREQDRRYGRPPAGR